jgi:hypothetical protein
VLERGVHVHSFEFRVSRFKSGKTNAMFRRSLLKRRRQCGERPELILYVRIELFCEAGGQFQQVNELEHV